MPINLTQLQTHTKPVEKEILETPQRIQLNLEEAERFVNIINNPPEANANLKRLFKKWS